MNTGVYQILNLLDGKRYIGSTAVSFAQRWSAHRMHLRRGRHHSRHLQSAWNRDGEESFEFSILRECPRTECVVLEQRFIDDFNASNSAMGYNITPRAGTCLGVKHSAESRQRMSSSAKCRTSESKMESARAAKMLLLPSMRLEWAKHRKKIAVWRHPLHGQRRCAVPDLIREFPEMKLDRAALQRIRVRNHKMYKGWRSSPCVV